MKSPHDIPEDTLNSDLEYCLNEYVRSIKHREMLRDWWFRDFTLDELAAKYGYSVARAKALIYTHGDDLIYTHGDRVILRASQK